MAGKNPPLCPPCQNICSGEMLNSKLHAGRGFHPRRCGSPDAITPGQVLRHHRSAQGRHGGTVLCPLLHSYQHLEFHITGKGILQSENILFYSHPSPLCRSKITRNHVYLAKIFLNFRQFRSLFSRPPMPFAWPIPTMTGQSRLRIKTHADFGSGI